MEISPIFHELHTQILAEAQGQLQPQLRPKYVARLERHLSEGGVWDTEAGVISLDRKEPDLTLALSSPTFPVSERQLNQGGVNNGGFTAVLATPTAQTTKELEPDELLLRKQRRIVIYLQARPRLAVTTIELLSPSNKAPGSIGQARYLEKRASAMHGGLHWVEIDLLRGGERPPLELALPEPADYLAYVAQTTAQGWRYLAYGWALADPLPLLPIPLLGEDRALLDLGACFRSAYDRIAADEEADYDSSPPPPLLKPEQDRWVAGLLRQAGLRK